MTGQASDGSNKLNEQAMISQSLGTVASQQRFQMEANRFTVHLHYPNSTFDDARRLGLLAARTCCLKLQHASVIARR